MDSIRTILLVDDENGEKEWSELLKGDYHIITARDSSMTLEQLKSFGAEISLVIINISLENRRGYKTLEMLMQKPQFGKLPVITFGEPENYNLEASALGLGAWDYIAKPFNGRVVRNRLRKAYEHKCREQEAILGRENGYGIGSRELEKLLYHMPCMAGICEYYNGSFSVLAGSKIINVMLEIQNGRTRQDRENTSIHREDQICIRNTLRSVLRNQGSAECSFWYQPEKEGKKWLNLKISYLEQYQGCKLFLYTITDKTEEMEMEQELRRYKSAIFKPDNYSNKILIVDDQEMNRVILKEIFRNHYEVLEASNGEEAIVVLEQNSNDVDVILLDLMMPVMDGSEFLEYKNSHPEIEDIPVVVITADGSMNQQVNTLALGADDYIVKPFVVEVVLRRIQNVLESHRRFREVLKEYNHIAAQAREDPLTKLYNRAAAQEHITRILNLEPEQMHSLIMLDVDRFKIINDTYGHQFGDRVLTIISAKIKEFFRDTDIVSRIGGDEFCVFMRSVSSANMALNKCNELCHEISSISLMGCDKELSVSVGVAVTSADASTFDALYRNADIALYMSKQNGRNQATLFGSADCVKGEM